MLTPNQIHERLNELKGCYKAAVENERMCLVDVEERAGPYELAVRAHDKARAQTCAIQLEARELVSQYAQQLEESIAPPDAPVALMDGPRAECLTIAPERAVALEDDLPEGWTRINEPFMAGDLPPTNGIDRAFDEATHPHD